MTIGILGGGQLGYMLALAGYPLGLRFRFLDPSPEAPVGRIAQRVTADFDDEAALEKFASGLELVTYEFENVPVAATRFLSERVAVFPPPAALEIAQDRLREKDFLRSIGVETTAYREISDPTALLREVRDLGYPAVLKTVRLGYDGKGQVTLTPEIEPEEVRAACQRFDGGLRRTTGMLVMLSEKATWVYRPRNRCSPTTWPSASIRLMAT